MSRPTLYAQDGRSTRPSIFIDHSAPAQAHATIAPAAASVPGTTGSSSARLHAKRQELEGLLMLKEQSARLARDVEKLGDNVDELVQGGDAVAAVMSSWAGVFRAVQIARASLATNTSLDGESERKVPETLVRLPVESVEQEKSSTKATSSG